MKNLLLVTGSILMICLIITSSYSGKKPEAAGDKAKIQEISSVVQERSTEAVPSDKKKYRLSEYEKRIAAFENGSEKPFYISDVYVSTLPPADRELLKKGIEAEDEKALKRLIQDYCS